MNEIRKICFYDFDDTLFDTPDDGRLIWKEKYGKEFSESEWWKVPESLDLKVFHEDIKPNKNILSRLKNDNDKKEILTVLLTSRIIELKSYIEKILNKYKIKLDEFSLKYEGKNKGIRVKEILKKYPDVEAIDIYDDRDKELKIFSNLKKEIGNKYDVNIHKVINGKIKKLSDIDLKKIINEEIKRDIMSIYKKYRS